MNWYKRSNNFVNVAWRKTKDDRYFPWFTSLLQSRAAAARFETRVGVNASFGGGEIGTRAVWKQCIFGSVTAKDDVN